ncbi:recombinase [Stutzerimonas stutzeri KOS6]|uniref:Recombinase n=1 Tax=Stutzerimonas stutzeri KOS6 TaxID=1218352 RepID=A0A061JM01_STUST|nr:recombinase [Stutzerimonas stutzeri KOS6]
MANFRLHFAGQQPPTKIREHSPEDLDFVRADSGLSSLDALPPHIVSAASFSQLPEECKRSTNNHTYPVALLCLVTGARWDEAESPTRAAIYGGKAHYHRTKNRQSRSVPIPKDVEALALKVGMPGNGRLFMPCRSAFRCAYRRCGFDTPGQMTHILRHTFASHYMAGGDILGPQRILGHSSITMTMRYAHLSPDHLESALRLSPLIQSGHAVVSA